MDFSGVICLEVLIAVSNVSREHIKLLSLCENCRKKPVKKFLVQSATKDISERYIPSALVCSATRSGGRSGNSGGKY